MVRVSGSVVGRGVVTVVGLKRRGLWSIFIFSWIDCKLSGSSEVVSAALAAASVCGTV